MATLNNKDNKLNQLYSECNLNSAIRTTEVDNQFLLVPKNVSTVRDYVVENTGNEDVSFGSGEYNISTSANGSDDVWFETVNIGRYRAGLVSVTGLYVRKLTEPSGKAEWGYGGEHAQDGFYVRYNSDGTLEFVIEKGGVETVIPESMWASEFSKDIVSNENNNESGFVWGFGNRENINLNDNGYIYRFDWSWYGGGIIVVNAIEVTENSYQRSVPLIAYQPRGQISIEQPNLPIFARLDNDGNATSDDMYVAGRQYSVLGKSSDAVRKTEHYNTGITVDTTATPVMAFRRKPTFQGIELGIDQYTIFTDQQTHYTTLVDPDIDITWKDPDGVGQSETSIEVADASELTNFDNTTGKKYGGSIVGEGKNVNSTDEESQFAFPVPRDEPVVLIMESLTGQSASVDVSMKINETW